MISIVIPCLNEVKFIDATLESLMNQENPGKEWEIIVVDGGSDDGTRDKLNAWVARDERVQWIDNPNRTTPFAMNLGIERAKGEIILILGAHSEVKPDFLIRNIELLNSHPESGCVGGVVEQVHGSDVSRRIGAAMSTPFGVGDARFRTGGNAGHVDTVAFGAYRKEVLDEIGWFDEALIRNQDDELNYRLLQSGWRIWFDPRVKSQYHVRATYRNLIRQYYQYGYWKVFVNRKHRTITTWRQTVPAIFLGVLMSSLTCWMMEEFGFWNEAWNGFGASIFFSAGFFWMVIGAGSAISAARSIGDVWGILKAYGVIHLGYGIGYWNGIWRFILLRANPSSSASNLTR